MRGELTLADFDISQFLANLDVLTGLYAAAMAPPAQQLPGRRAIMQRHATYGAFRAVVALRPGSPIGDGTRERDNSGQYGGQYGSGQYGGYRPGRNGEPGGGRPAAAPLAGFAYGFHGEAGQWWHDLVSDALARRQGRRAARVWMGDSFEVAEVHVHPDYQGRGTGHAMLLRLTADRPEHTAVLSTMDADTSAHRLYRGLGFADLIPSFLFPGTGLPYSIMGATLPLAGLSPASF